MRFFMRQTSDDLKQLWTQINRALSIVQVGLEADNHAFSHTSSLGYVTTCPSKLGTGMKVTVALSLPHLGNSPNFPALCNALRLVSTREYGSVLGRDIWTITNVDCLGVSEVDIVSGIIQGCARLVALETRSERGESIFDAIPGLGKEPFPGFSLDKCPPRLPDLTYHKTLVADVLRTHPDVYRKLRRTSTRMGVQLAPCIKPGIDTKGSSEHPVSGLVAGDAESFTTFQEIFHPVIAKLHPAFRICPKLWTCPIHADLSKVVDFEDDASSGYIHSVRVEFRSNIDGFRLAPCCSDEERRDVERLTVKGMLRLTKEFPGEYMPLPSSMSYTPREGGISKSLHKQLCEEGLGFSEPTLPLHLAAGLGANWPDARGIFLTTNRNLAVWCNESDHLRIISFQPGARVKAACACVVACAETLQEQLQIDGHQYMLLDALGYLAVSPEHLGHGLHCTLALNLPRLGSRLEFGALCKAFGASGTWRAGYWDISSVPSVGTAWEEIVNRVIKASSQLIRLEKMLEKGVSIDHELKSVHVSMEI